jgi:ferredoxin-NADP reductase
LTPPAPLRWRVARVVDVAAETSRVRTIALDVPDWPGHRPGQHVDVRLTAEDGYQTERSYSIASPPDDDGIALTVEQLEDGEVSEYLVGELRVGDRLELRGPIGGYFVWEADVGGPLLLVGGGSGIVPLMAMLRHRVAAGSDTPVRLLASWRRPEEVIYAAELEALAGFDGIEIAHTFTRSQPEGWTGYGRRVDTQMLTEVAWPADAGARTYVCGPTGFVEAVASGLVDLGHDPATIRTERFGPTGG